MAFLVIDLRRGPQRLDRAAVLADSAKAWAPAVSLGDWCGERRTRPAGAMRPLWGYREQRRNLFSGH